MGYLGRKLFIKFRDQATGWFAWLPIGMQLKKPISSQLKGSKQDRKGRFGVITCSPISYAACKNLF